MSEEAAKPDRRPWTKRQRTVEEAMAGVPPRQYTINKGRKKKRNPKTGIMIARAQQGHRKKKFFNTPEARQRARERMLQYWEKIRSDPELIRKRFEATAKAGRRGAAKRRCTPRGWRYDDWILYWNKMVREATKIVSKLEEEGRVSYLNEDEEKQQMGREALQYGIAVIRGGEGSVKDRISAARLVADFTLQKPTARSEVKVETAEDFLSRVADDLNI